MTMLEMGKWEYDCLKRDMESQNDSFDYQGGFKAWYREVFLVDDTWREVREDVLNYH